MGSIQTKAEKNGYRVIKVAPKSPGKKAGLVEFVDFIIGIDDFATETSLTANYDAFFDIIKRNENQLVTLNVYNILTRTSRKVPVIPHKGWEKADSLLGILVRYEDYSAAHERVLKVTAVNPKSPAASIGLDPGNDYILGASNQLRFISPTDTIEPQQIQPMEIFIYNAKKKRVWSTSVTPLSNWEMGGYLGCEFAPEDTGSLPYEPEAEANRKGKESGSRFKNEKLVQRLEQASSQKKGINLETTNVQSQTDLSEKPPTDSELGRRKTMQINNETTIVRDKRSCSFDLSDEVTSSRIKLLHGQNTRKGSFRMVSQPFNESGTASLSHLQGSITLENLDEEEDVDSPRNQNPKDMENTEKQEVCQTQASVQTIDQSITEGSHENEEPKFKSQQAPTSLLSISSDVTKETQVEKDKESQVEEGSNHYKYFSQKLGRDYVIKPVDLFNLSEICIK